MKVCSPSERWFGTQLHRIMVRHRLFIRDGRGADPHELSRSETAIVSPLPDVWINTGGSEFSGRRRFVRIRTEAGVLSLRARVRPVPPVTEDVICSEVLAERGRDRLGRHVPLAFLDASRRTLHLLVDLATAESLEAPAGADPRVLLADFLVERPLVSLLPAMQMPVVGPKVREAIRSLLHVALPTEEERLRGEMRFLQSLVCDYRGALHDVGRRIEKIKGMLANMPRKPPPAEPTGEQVEEELRMMCRMVERRTCAELRFLPGEIWGTVNPAPEGPAAGRGPMEFKLSIDFRRPRPWLRIWSLPREAHPDLNPYCLGQGDAMLFELQAGADLYGMVDLVLNYMDTNKLGPPHDRRGDSLDETFAELRLELMGSLLERCRVTQLSGSE